MENSELVSCFKRQDLSLGILFLLAQLGFFTGCAAWTEVRELQAADDYLRSAKTLLRRGDFEAALRENQRALSLAQDRPPADEAIFNIGVIYTQADNPEKDLEKATVFFKRVIEQYPESRFVAWARIWLGMIQEGERSVPQQPEWELKKRGEVAIGVP